MLIVPAKQQKLKYKIITTFSDPGHAWARVTKRELLKLGIQNKISPYSYMNGENVFLEEDGDLGIYVKALVAIGVVIKYKESWTNRQSKIRNYEGYHL